MNLVKRVDELDQANENIEATVVELRERLAKSNEQGQGDMQETEQLRVKYRESLDQIKSFESQIGDLNAENQNYQVKISELNAAKEAMSLQPEDNTQSELTEKIRILGDEKQTLMQENQSNLQQIQILSQEKQGLMEQLGESQVLTQRISELEASNESYVSEIAALNAREMEAPVEPPAVEPEAELTTDVAESDIALLKRKNRMLSQSNSEFEKENRSLTRQLAEFEDQDVDLGAQREVSTGSLAIQDTPVASLPAVVPKVGGSILSWLLPFLAIGLGVAFFVIMREELHKSPTASGARAYGTRDIGKTHSQEPRRGSDNDKRRDNENRS